VLCLSAIRWTLTYRVGDFYLRNRSALRILLDNTIDGIIIGLDWRELIHYFFSSGLLTSKVNTGMRSSILSADKPNSLSRTVYAIHKTESWEISVFVGKPQMVEFYFTSSGNTADRAARSSDVSYARARISGASNELFFYIRWFTKHVHSHPL